MNENTTSLRMALATALEAAGLPVKHLHFFNVGTVMVGDPETGAVLITGALDRPCSDTLEILACRYPSGYDPADPRQDLPEAAAIVYETQPGDPQDAAENLARLVEAITTTATASAQRTAPARPITPAQRTADARALARALGFAAEEVTAAHLDEIARSAYARAAVWFGEDAALMADDAQELFEEEQNEYDGDQEQGTEPAARTAFVHRARQHLDRSGRPVTEPADAHEAERVRALYVDILASTMHAHQEIEGDHYDIYDAHQAFTGLERTLTR